jgi:L-iditol 2-dehydrogenase
MKALVKFATGPGNVEVREVDEPRMRSDQVTLEVAWCGICGTDLHVLHDTFRNFPPVILGHEIAARVVAKGKDVYGWSDAERVSVLGASTVTCGHCIYCRAGEFMFCPERRGMGHGVNGGFTRHIVARPDQLFRLPQELPLEEGALCEPLAAAVHAVCELTPARLGDVAFVSGPGPIGLLCLKLLVAQGLKVIMAGTDADVDRLAQAQMMGAALTVNVNRDDWQEIAREECGGLGPDIVVECAGAGASVRNCLQIVRPLGHYTQVGHFGREATIPFDQVAFKQLKVTGSVGYTAATWVRTLQILEQKKITVGDLITHKLPLEKWQEGFNACEDRSATKVLLHP